MFSALHCLKRAYLAYYNKGKFFKNLFQSKKLVCKRDVLTRLKFQLCLQFTLIEWFFAITHVTVLRYWIKNSSSLKSVTSFMDYSFTKSLIVFSSSINLFPNPGVSMTVTFGRDLFPRRCPKSRHVFFVFEEALRIKSNVFCQFNKKASAFGTLPTLFIL